MKKYLRIYEENPNAKAISKVVKILNKDGVIIMPTDTIYAFACSSNSTSALTRLAQLKNVKLEKAKFSFICKDLSILSEYVNQISTPKYKLLKKALPGPYTFILPSNNKLPKIFKKKKTLGIRIPKNSIVREILDALGTPIISASVRIDDQINEYITDPELIYENWKEKVDLIIDGGFGNHEASTVINLCEDEPEIIREGLGDTSYL